MVMNRLTLLPTRPPDVLFLAIACVLI